LPTVIAISPTLRRSQALRRNHQPSSHSNLSTHNRPNAGESSLRTTISDDALSAFRLIIRLMVSPTFLSPSTSISNSSSSAHVFSCYCPTDRDTPCLPSCLSLSLSVSVSYLTTTIVICLCILCQEWGVFVNKRSPLQEFFPGEWPNPSSSALLKQDHSLARVLVKSITNHRDFWSFK
jgi:hypothetical protein